MLSKFSKLTLKKFQTGARVPSAGSAFEFVKQNFTRLKLDFISNLNSVCNIFNHC